jgi:Tol biopolymer transport system component
MRRCTLAACIAAIGVVALALATTSFAGSATTERVNVSSSGEEANGYSSSYQGISADGRYVAFSSSAPNLVPGDTNHTGDVFVRDRQLNTIERVSVSSTGGQANGSSGSAAISADGRYVAFVSEASNLVPGHVGGLAVFVRDRKLHTTTKVSVPSTGGQANNQSGFRRPAISANGRYVVFDSRASNLVSRDRNGTKDIFVRDQKLGTTRLVSVSSSGRQANNFSFFPAISADGRYIAFQSKAGNLVANDTNGTYDVFLRDRRRHTTKRVSVSSTGRQANGESFPPAISADGRYIVFGSHARNLVHRDTNRATDVFVRDRKRHTTRRVSVSSREHQGNDSSVSPTISADGRYVAFSSKASNLIRGDTNRDNDVFVRDRKHHTTKRMSVSSAGKQGNGDSGSSTISANGHSVAFVSEASDLVPGDTNGTPDVFVRGPLP